MQTMRAALGCLALVGVMLAAACGSGEGDAASRPSPREAPSENPAEPTGTAASTPRRIDPRAGGLELQFGEFAITMEASEIRPGPVTFVVHNRGELVHGFEIEGEDGDDDNSGPGHGGLKLEGPSFDSGETVRLHADLPPGVYEIECFVAEHDDLGMRATLVVAPGAPPIRVEEPPTGAGTVEIADFGFAPDAIEVAAGTEVRWTNGDPTAHTVTAEDGFFDSGTLDPGASFAATLNEVGTHEYVCQIHPSMRASVRVVGPT